MALIQHTFDTPYPVGEVHCYSTEREGERLLFDTGPPTPAAREGLKRWLDEGTGPLHVVCTHCHIDHYGLAAWLEREYGAQVYIPFRDDLKIRRHEERLAGIAALLRQEGFSDSYIESYRQIMQDGSVFPEFPRHAVVIEESDLPARLGFEVIACPGHSQSDLVYAGDDWAVTGDVLLRGIFQSPLYDIDLLTGERFNNYRAYCQSLPKLAALSGKTIWPGHRYRVDKVEEILLFYVGKLLERTARVAGRLRAGSLAEATIGLFGDQAGHPFRLYLKASELAFMRDFLREPERLRRALEQVGLFAPLEEVFEQAAG